MPAAKKLEQDGVERLPVQRPKAVLVPALAALSEELVHACPGEAQVSFRFDGKLHVDIDVRCAEQAMLVERLLPTLRMGMFGEVRRAISPKPFLLRITAEVTA